MSVELSMIRSELKLEEVDDGRVELLRTYSAQPPSLAETIFMRQ